jgi:hypothetical protein
MSLLLVNKKNKHVTGNYKSIYSTDMAGQSDIMDTILAVQPETRSGKELLSD